MSHPYPDRAGRRQTRRAPLGLVVLALVGVILVGAVSSFAGEQTRPCTVTGADRARNRDGGSDMRVYTEQCGTLQVRDLWLRGQFSSADIFGALQDGHTYNVTTVGWRVPIVSRFPTILGTPLEIAAP